MTAAILGVEKGKVFMDEVREVDRAGFAGAAAAGRGVGFGYAVGCVEGGVSWWPFCFVIY